MALAQEVDIFPVKDKAHREWWRKNHPVRRVHGRSSTVRWSNRRKRLIESLGGKCVRCGFSDWRALQLDHVNGGGTKQYHKDPGTYYWRLYAGKVEPKDIQLLCSNCNWIKRYEENECRSCGTRRES